MLDKAIWRKLSSRWAMLAMAAMLAAAFGPGGAVLRADETDDPTRGAIKITILHVNDSHGHLEPWTDSDGNSVGGWARVAALVSQIRAAGPGTKVYLVHAGDEFSWGDETTTKTTGEVNIAIMNALKFDLFTPGNGEFYEGLRNLQARQKQATFPFLTANVYVKSTGLRLGSPFVIETVGGANIAFFGLCTVRTNLPSAWPLRVDDAVETATKLVPDLRRQADLIVGITHLGDDKDVAIAQAVAGIDVIIGGHSHTEFPKGKIVLAPDKKDVLICQAGEYLRWLGRVDLALRPAGKTFRIISAKAQLIPVNKSVQMDPAVTAIIAKAAAATQPASRPAGGKTISTTRPAKTLK